MTIDGTETATVTGTLAAIGGDRDRPGTEGPGVAMMMPTPTCRAGATEIESAKTGTRDATDAIANGTATGVGAGTPGATMTTGLRDETETSTMTDADRVTGTMVSLGVTGDGARPRLPGSESLPPT